MRATATALENNRVKLHVEVEAEAINLAIDATAKSFAEQINVKGFRKGKAPRAMIEAQIGGPLVLRAEALQNAIPDLYARAVADTLIDPIAQPEINIVSGEDAGDVVFEATVEVRPEITLTGYKNLKVEIPSPNPSDEEIEDQLNRLRITDAELVTVERGILKGDHVTMDVVAVDPADEGNNVDVEDYVYEVGTGNLTDGVDELIIGLKSGETLELTGRGAKLQPMNWKFTLKEVRERVLPDLTDEWVEENTEYADVAALREGLTAQMKRMKVVEAQMGRRDATLLALAELVDESVVPDALVYSETDQRIHDLAHRLEQQRLDIPTFLRVTNQTEEQLVEVMQTDAKKAVRIDLALRGLVKAENLTPTEEEIDAELETTAEAMGVPAELLRENLRDSGRTVAFHAEVAKMKASRWLYAETTYVDPNGAEIDKSLFEENQSDAFLDQ